MKGLPRSISRTVHRRAEVIPPIIKLLSCAWHPRATRVFLPFLRPRSLNPLVSRSARFVSRFDDVTFEQRRPHPKALAIYESSVEPDRRLIRRKTPFFYLLHNIMTVIPFPFPFSSACRVANRLLLSAGENSLSNPYPVIS